MSEWITTCTKRPDWLNQGAATEQAESYCLVIVWSAAEPARIGEVAFVETRSDALILGRGGSTAGDQAERLRFFRQRPGSLQLTAPLQGEGLSRNQCELRTGRAGIQFSNVGRQPAKLDGQPSPQGLLEPGHILTINDQLILLCTRRVSAFERHYFDMVQSGDFGGADRHGIVGESPAAWELREQLAFCAASNNHVLVMGESGSGKELAARAIHQMSSRSSRPLVTRNAATFPVTLIDAELFGNAPNYPNAGMPARNGVIGEAHQSTLLLDEIGELSHDLQAHLLRVLDCGGEYQRLGDAQPRHSSFRLIAATNRDPTELRLDVMARLTLQIQVPNLLDRIEDIPLLVRHLLREAARSRADLRDRFFDQSANDLQPRVDPELIELLLLHQYRYNVRELDALLWKALAGSHGEYVALTQEVRSELGEARREPARRSGEANTREITANDIVDCLNRCDQNVATASRELGLKSRYALYRLMRKHGIAVERTTQ